MEADYIIIGEQRYKVDKWVDDKGMEVVRENAVGAVGKNEDGTWWAINFDNCDIYLEQ